MGVWLRKICLLSIVYIRVYRSYCPEPEVKVIFSQLNVFISVYNVGGVTPWPTACSKFRVPFACRFESVAACAPYPTIRIYVQTSSLLMQWCMDSKSAVICEPRVSCSVPAEVPPCTPYKFQGHSLYSRIWHGIDVILWRMGSAHGATTFVQHKSQKRTVTSSESNMDMAAKRKEPAGSDVDAENQVPAVNLAQVVAKRRFVPPKMAVPPGQTSKQPLSMTQRNMQQPMRGAAGNPKPARAAGPIATSTEPTQYYTVLYAKKSNKVTMACKLQCRLDTATSV